MIRLDLNKIENIKLQSKLAIRKLLPPWFLSITRRRQVPLKKMLDFLAQHPPQPDRDCVANDITIVVPCYNHGRYLRKTFESIIKQTRMPEAVIFINDHSTDDTKNVLEELISGYQKTMTQATPTIFTVITNDRNIGQAMTINKGIALAKTDLIMILNDDDYLMNYATEFALDVYRKNREIRLFGANCIQFSKETILDTIDNYSTRSVEWAKAKIEIRHPKDALSYEDYCSLNMTHSGSSFYRKCAGEAGMYREKKQRIVPFSDRDFQIRMNLLYPVGIANDVPICLWRSNSSVDSGVNS